MINSINNQFNLAETEYVIFGSTDMKTCLEKSYTGIGTGNLLNSDSWCSYDIKVVRGY